VIRQIDRKVRSDEWKDTVRTERRRRSAAEN
jgi:hypothetical protein